MIDHRTFSCFAGGGVPVPFLDPSRTPNCSHESVQLLSGVPWRCEVNFDFIVTDRPTRGPLSLHFRSVPPDRPTFRRAQRGNFLTIPESAGPTDRPSSALEVRSGGRYIRYFTLQARISRPTDPPRARPTARPTVGAGRPTDPPCTPWVTIKSKLTSHRHCVSVKFHTRTLLLFCSTPTRSSRRGRTALFCVLSTRIGTYRVAYPRHPVPRRARHSKGTPRLCMQAA